MKRFVLFTDNYKDFMIVDTHKKLHADGYKYSIREILDCEISYSYYARTGGRVNDILDQKISRDIIILESDIPITIENYPELAIWDYHANTNQS